MLVLNNEWRAYPRDLTENNENITIQNEQITRSKQIRIHI